MDMYSTWGAWDSVFLCSKLIIALIKPITICHITRSVWAYLDDVNSS